jgi:hypothetical protein
VQNPFRTEAEAYHFLLVVIACFGAIVLASLLGGPWAGVPVFVVVSAAVTYYYVKHGPARRPAQTAPRRHEPGEHRILVVANETVGGRVLLDEIRRHAEGRPARVQVVSPALNSPLRHWASDEDGARAAAQKRLEQSLAHLREVGIAAEGTVGDADPLQAIEDSLRTFGADEIVLSTHPEGRSSWLERGVVDAARERFAVPISHVVVDLQAEREEVPG